VFGLAKQLAPASIQALPLQPLRIELSRFADQYRPSRISKTADRTPAMQCVDNADMASAGFDDSRYRATTVRTGTATHRGQYR
jgi:hypothetical protein